MKFDEIIDVKHWQNIQDVFSSIIGISLRTIDSSGEIIVRPSNMALICEDAVAQSPLARKKCWQWYTQLAKNIDKHKTEGFYENVCPLGLVNFAMPISFNDAETVFLIVGPLVYEDSQKDTRLTECLHDSGVDEGKFFEYFNQLPVMSMSKLNSIVEFLNAITAFMAKLKDFDNRANTEGFVFNNEQIGFLLKTFLELAMKICAAERGSVMVFEKQSQLLSIHEATGLSQEIIANTKIKPGQGLAGLTIERKKALFLNDNLSDRNLKIRMHKPTIKSAFVIPVFQKDKILGVISVGTAKSPNRFSDKLMELLNELVGMALEKVDLD
ncbi:MAG: PocR ligand-binding domain-containing protein [Candidatus Omnitrophota bacterium]